MASVQLRDTGKHCRLSHRGMGQSPRRFANFHNQTWISLQIQVRLYNEINNIISCRADLISSGGGGGGGGGGCNCTRLHPPGYGPVTQSQTYRQMHNHTYTQQTYSHIYCTHTYSCGAQRSYFDLVGSKLQHGELGQRGETLHLGQLVLDQEELAQVAKAIQPLHVTDVIEREVQHTASQREVTEARVEHSPASERPGPPHNNVR